MGIHQIIHSHWIRAFGLWTLRTVQLKQLHLKKNKKNKIKHINWYIYLKAGGKTLTLSLYYHDPRCFYRTLFSAFSLHGFECVKPLKTKIVFHSVVLTISQTYLHYIISTDIFISIQRLAKTLWKSTPKCSHLIFVRKKNKTKNSYEKSLTSTKNLFFF